MSLRPKRDRPEGEILEELVSSVRSVEMRVRDAMDNDNPQKRRRTRIHPVMMHEVSHIIAQGPRDPIKILIFASFVRDEIPWLYELALDAYQDFRNGRKEQGQRSLKRFRDALELIQRGPFLDELGISRNFLHMARGGWFELFQFEFEDFDDPPINTGRKRGIAGNDGS